MKNKKLGQDFFGFTDEQKSLVTIGLSVDTPTAVRLAVAVGLGVIAGVLVAEIVKRQL